MEFVRAKTSQRAVKNKRRDRKQVQSVRSSLRVSIYPMARVERRFRLRDLYRFLIPVIVASLAFLVYTSFFLAYRLHIRPSSDNDGNGSVFLDKDLNWREREALKSVRSIFSKEVLGVINATTTSNSDNPLSVESLRKINLSKPRIVEEAENTSSENQMVTNFGHDAWISKGNQVLNDTLSQRNLRDERRVKRAEELTNDETVQQSEKSAMERSRVYDFEVAVGNYSLWKSEYRKIKNLRDKLSLLEDQIIMARVYVSITRIKNNVELYKELERQLAKPEPTNDERVLDRIREMGQILAKAEEKLFEYKLVANKLRAMIQTAEEELDDTKAQITFYTQLAAKTLPLGIHCFTMRLTLAYYHLPLLMTNFPRMENPKLYHYALFSDNVLAVSVVVNSTVINAKDPSRHVFHLVTDKHNYPAMRMWFLLNPPGDATIQVEKYEDFVWLNSSYSPVLRQLESASTKTFYFKTDRSESVETGSENLKYRYPKYISMLNHLRFYLPEMFPKLDKILFLDDDVVVQKDLTPLWSIDLKGKVNGAVENCGVSFHRLDTYLNFSDRHVSENFDPKACGWAYGMNVFDLKEWKKKNITETYHFWQNLNENRTLWKLGTLPPGLITFYNLTLPLESKWHLLGLGYDKGISTKEIEKSAVIHFNGHMKPWTELGISKYQPYWRKYINFEHPHISSCKLFD